MSPNCSSCLLDNPLPPPVSMSKYQSCLIKFIQIKIDMFSFK